MLLNHLSQVAHPQSGLFLQAIPKSNHLTFSPQEFLTALKHRLHLPLYAPARKIPTCTCKTRPDIDVYGHHLLCCHVGNEVQLRHNHVVNDFAALARQAGLHVGVEPRNIYLESHLNLRPDVVIYQSPLHRGVTTCFDVTIIKAQEKESGKDAVERASKSKHNKYADAADLSNTGFEPLAQEVHGAVSAQFTHLFQQLIHLICDRCPGTYPPSVLSQYWLRRLSVTLAKENASLLNCRLDRILAASQQAPAIADVSHDLLHEVDGLNPIIAHRL